MFPESFTFSIADWVNGWVDSLVTNYGDVFRHISDTLLWAIVSLEGLLRAAPWWLMLAIVGVIAWHATRKVVTTAVIVGLLFLVGAVEGWYVPRFVIEGDAKRKLEAKAPDLKNIADLGK